MTIEEQFYNNTFEQLQTAISNFNEDDLNNIYALSFWKSNIDDDPRQPTLTVGYNTIKQWQDCRPLQLGEEPSKIRKASSNGEAKWNFAYWIQNEELIIGGNDIEFQNYIQKSPFYYTNNDKELDWDKTFELGEKIQQEFIQLIIQLSNRLFKEEILKQKFGHEVPIIIHELEYSEKIVKWTKAANPEGLTLEFENWVNNN